MSDYISKSYPYLSIARYHDVPYGVVLWLTGTNAEGFWYRAEDAVDWTVRHLSTGQRMSLIADIDSVRRKEPGAA